MLCRVGDGIGLRNADAIESERARLLLNRFLESAAHGPKTRRVNDSV